MSDEVVSNDVPKAPLKPLTSTQRAFLKCVDSAKQTLDEILVALRIDDSTFARWLDSKSFRKAADKALRRGSRRRDMGIEIDSFPASRELSKLSTGAGVGQARDAARDHVKRLADINMIALARDFRARQRTARARTKRGQPIVPQPVLPGPHPDVPLEQIAELERILDA